MTELRKRMIECLQLRGLSERTQESYVRAVRQLAEHYHKSPDLITEEELRQYFLFIKNVKHYARNTSTVAICGIKFFFEKTLNRDWATFGLLRAPREKKLPVILSREEVRQLLGRIRLPRYRVCLATIYSCGLRLQEGTNLRVADIDSARQMIHVRHGKGAKDRYVPLPQRCSCCANIGRHIAIHCCSFPPQAVTISTWRALRSRCPGAACRMLSTPLSKTAVSTNALPCIRCAIRGPRSCWKRALTCD
jgi:site-specific recombinase XerD